MPDDPTQQPDQSQLPSWISRAGSAIGSGLTQALPYAVPAVLGAAMGRGVGGGAAAGALAGAGMAGGDIQEQQRTQQEFGLRQQEMLLESQKWDVEKQKIQQDLAAGKDTEDALKNIKDPLQRAAARQDLPGWIQQQEFKQWFNHVSNDPGYAQKNGLPPQVIAAMQGLPYRQQQEVLTKYAEAQASGKVTNGFHQITNKDGSTTLFMAGPIDPATGMPHLTPLAGGVSTKTIPGAPTPDKRGPSISERRQGRPCANEPAAFNHFAVERPA